MDEMIAVYGQVNYRLRTPMPAPFVYPGPDSVVSGAVNYWGLRAYSNAAIGANACRIRRASDNAEQDFVTLADGSLDRASIVTFLASTTGAFVKFYDQVSTNHLQQTTAANQAAVNLSGIGSLVTADFTAASAHNYSSVSAITRAQPYTVSTVVKTVSNSVRQQLIQASDGGRLQSGWNLGGGAGTASDLYLFAGSVLTVTATAGTMHAIQEVYNTTSSDGNIDGTSNVGSVSVGNVTAETLFVGADNIAGTPLNGQLLELIFYPAAFTGTQSSNMSANQHSFWGF